MQGYRLRHDSSPGQQIEHARFRPKARPISLLLNNPVFPAQLVKAG
jgi:hypothetical protein